MVILKTLVGNLSANVNEITFTDVTINSNSIIEVYYNSNDVYTVETWQREDTIGIVTSDHNFPVSVKVLINNVVAFEPYDDSEVLSQLNALDGRVTDTEDAISGLATRVGDAEDDIDALEDAVSNLNTSKQDKLTAGDNITIENNVISASGGGEIAYTNTERVVGTWIDGKPLYEKTMYVPSPVAGGYYNHHVDNVDTIFITDVNCKRNGSWHCGIYHINAGDFVAVLIHPLPTQGVYFDYRVSSLTDAYITYRYTKTTD